MISCRHNLAVGIESERIGGMERKLVDEWDELRSILVDLEADYIPLSGGLLCWGHTVQRTKTLPFSYIFSQ